MPYGNCSICMKRFPPLPGEELCEHIKLATELLHFALWTEKNNRKPTNMLAIDAYVRQRFEKDTNDRS